MTGLAVPFSARATMRTGIPDASDNVRRLTRRFIRSARSDCPGDCPLPVVASAPVAPEGGSGGSATCGIGADWGSPGIAGNPGGGSDGPAWRARDTNTTSPGPAGSSGDGACWAVPAGKCKIVAMVLRKFIGCVPGVQAGWTRRR